MQRRSVSGHVPFVHAVSTCSAMPVGFIESLARTSAVKPGSSFSGIGCVSSDATCFPTALGDAERVGDIARRALLVIEQHERLAIRLGHARECRSDERLLRDVFAERAVARAGVRHRRDHVRVALDQRAKRGALAATTGVDQLGIARGMAPFHVAG
jgi:hypothetical protein